MSLKTLKVLSILFLVIGICTAAATLYLTIAYHDKPRPFNTQLLVPPVWIALALMFIMIRKKRLNKSN